MSRVACPVYASYCVNPKGHWKSTTYSICFLSWKSCTLGLWGPMQNMNAENLLVLYLSMSMPLIEDNSHDSFKDGIAALQNFVMPWVRTGVPNTLWISFWALLTIVWYLQLPKGVIFCLQCCAWTCRSDWLLAMTTSFLSAASIGSWRKCLRMNPTTRRYWSCSLRSSAANVVHTLCQVDNHGFCSWLGLWWLKMDVGGNRLHARQLMANFWIS